MTTPRGDRIEPDGSLLMSVVQPLHREPPRAPERTSLPMECAQLAAGIERRLAGEVERMASAESCPRLVEAVRYSLLAPGKRVRPMLCLLATLDLDGSTDEAMDAACAIEMVHCASLMLDDLPAMDNARMRRGRPATHLRFGEATTLLAAIALLNQAYQVMLEAAASESRRIELVGRLARAVGMAGLVSGQSRDLGERSDELDGDRLARINHQKTAVLFELAIAAAATREPLDLEQRRALDRFARQIGLAFQTADDLLDGRKRDDSGKCRGLDRGKAGSVHALGETALIERLERELALADQAIAGPGMERSRVGRYVRALFDRVLA